MKKIIVDKEIVSKTLRDYIFMTGILDVDSKYLKKRIDAGIQDSSLNYTTNVYGKHTEWKFFNTEKKLKVLLFQIIDHLEDLDLPLEKFYLEDAWGLIVKFGDYTKKHNHNSFYLSGVLYLNDHHQKLYFPEINQEITPQKGRFVIFSSFLMHYTKRNIRHKDKYAISFNFKGALVGDKV